MLPEKATKLSQFHGPSTTSFLSYHSLSSKDTHFFPGICFLGQPRPLPHFPHSVRQSSMKACSREGMFSGRHAEILLRTHWQKPLRQKPQNGFLLHSEVKEEKRLEANAHSVNCF